MGLTISQLMHLLSKYQDVSSRDVQFTVQGVVVEVQSIKSEDKWTVSGADEDGPLFDTSNKLVIELRSDNETNQHIEANQYFQTLMEEYNRVQSENLKLRQEMELIQPAFEWDDEED